MLGSALLPQPTAVVIAVAAVKIGSRHRQDMGDIAALAASIAKVGLLHPIVVTPNNELIADGKAQASTRTCHCRADLDRQRWVRWARAKQENANYAVIQKCGVSLKGY